MSTENTKEEVFLSDKAESTLNTIATIILAIGIIVAFFLLWIGYFESRQYFSDEKLIKEFCSQAFVILISSIITWSTLKVFINISLSLKGIYKRLKKNQYTENEVVTAKAENETSFTKE